MNNTINESKYKNRINYLQENPHLGFKVVNFDKYLLPNCAGVFSWITDIHSILDKINKDEVIEFAKEEYGVEIKDKHYYPSKGGPGYVGFFLTEFFLRKYTEIIDTPEKDSIVTILRPKGIIDNKLGSDHIGLYCKTDSDGKIEIFNLDGNTGIIGFRKISPEYGFKNNEIIRFHKINS